MVPFFGTLNIRCRIIIGTQKGAIILTNTHILYGDHIRTIFPYSLLATSKYG